MNTNQTTKITTLKIKRALISVADKSGLIDFVKGLLQWDIEIISTGGTYNELLKSGISVKTIEDFTGFPEILGGRVKTLNPRIFGAILANLNNIEHIKEVEKLEIPTIDLVVVNLYPFDKQSLKQSLPLEEAIELIDIGGQALLRAAAKNFENKVVICNPSRYNILIEELKKNKGCVSYNTRLEFAKEVFQYTFRYEAYVAKYFSSIGESNKKMPETFSLLYRKVSELRYGENPHQQAALYGDFYNYFEKLHGKELSFNNIVDIEAAYELISEFTEPTAAIIKHTNPCGVGSDDKLFNAYQKAYTTDPKAAFGGVIAFNRDLDLETAKAVNELFTEVIIAPNFPPEVLEFLRKKKDRRLIRSLKPLDEEISIKKIAGGILVQEVDRENISRNDLKVVTKRQPTEEEISAMLYGWRVVKHLKSNAIVFSRPDRTIGVGAGQMSRVDSTKFAILKAKKAKLDLKGSAMASDGFFPFPDSIKEAAKVGVTAVIQPGGSIRDAEVIKAADEKNMAMVFTGIRHFKH